MTIVATALGFLPGGSQSAAQASSSDGSIIVGNATDAEGNGQAVYWDSANTIHVLPSLATSPPSNTANGCNPAGTVIVGLSFDNDGNKHAVTWTGGPSWAITDLGFLPGNTQSEAFACSSDGAVVVGISISGVNYVPCVWVSGVAAALPLLAGYPDGISTACSADGSIIVGGLATGPTTSIPTTWTGAPSWSVTQLPTLGFGGAVFCCSSDGLTVCGEVTDSGNNGNACYWNPGLNLVAGSLAGPGSQILCCDATASTLGGFDVNGNATVWISGAGQELPTFAGGAVNDITGVSPDATFASGIGTNSDSDEVAIRWELAPPPPPPTPPVVLPPLCGWRGLTGINWNGLALVGDKFTNVVGLSDFTIFTEFGNEMRMLATAPPLHEDRKRVFVSRFEVEVEAGLGTPGAPGSAPLLILDYSKDGGVTWIPLQVFRSMGKAGEYIKRLRWINLGQSRTWVFRIQYSGSARPSVIGTYIDYWKALG